MSNVIEQAAREYADVAKPYLLGEEMELVRNAFEADAEWALANQWHNVKEELPPIDTMVIIRTKNGSYGSSMVYNSIDSLGNDLGQQWKGSTNFVRSIAHWCEIPKFNEKGGE